jgi:hypothetical protein
MPKTTFGRGRALPLLCLALPCPALRVRPPSSPCTSTVKLDLVVRCVRCDMTWRRKVLTCGCRELAAIAALGIGSCHAMPSHPIPHGTLPLSRFVLSPASPPCLRPPFAARTRMHSNSNGLEFSFVSLSRNPGCGSTPPGATLIAETAQLMAWRTWHQLPNVSSPPHTSPSSHEHMML